jgi:tRNA A-37 threonylcarbamoyl transferase component Bud32
VVDQARLAALFDAAIDLAPDDREALLASECGDDLSLKTAVLALLRADASAAPEFLAAPPALPPEPPPTRLGRFELVRPLGAGGMGEVYAAHDPLLGRDVAVKLLHARSAVARELLLREGQGLARLSHPNVVPVYDLGEHDGRVYLAMELVDGLTLRTWQQGQPPDWRVRLPPLLDAARGLAAAHDAGVTHGDVKPDNLLVGRDGRVRVVDFGLARTHGRAREAGTGLYFGTPAYMAPEQRRGAAADARSDQYAFCVTAHECLLGQRPGDSPAPAIELPARLAAAVRRGLADDPEARFPSMHALIAELAAVLGRDPNTDLSIAREIRHRVFFALVALVAAIDLLVHVRGFGRPVPDAADLVRIAVLALAGVGLAVALAWRRLGTRINRQLALLLVVGMATMLAHRLLGARFGQPGPQILAVDLLCFAALAALAAVLLQRWLWLPVLACLAAATVAALVPDAASIAMSSASWSMLLAAVVALRARSS